MPDTRLKTLPNGQTVRLGTRVVVSYWGTRDVTARVIGWQPGQITVDYNSDGFEGLDVPDSCVDEVLG